MKGIRSLVFSDSDNVLKAGAATASANRHRHSRPSQWHGQGPDRKHFQSRNGSGRGQNRWCHHCKSITHYIAEC